MNQLYTKQTTWRLSMKFDSERAKAIRANYRKTVCCEVCGSAREGGNRSKYCGNKCRQKAYRERNAK